MEGLCLSVPFFSHCYVGLGIGLRAGSSLVVCVVQISLNGRNLLDASVAGKVGRCLSHLSEFSGFRVGFLDCIAGAYEFQGHQADHQPSRDCDHFMAWSFLDRDCSGIRTGLDSLSIL